MSGFLEMMILPVLMAIVLVAMHSHLGFHVVKRGVIFVDIALAQVAALGVAISLLLGGEPGSASTYAIALAVHFWGLCLFQAPAHGSNGFLKKHISESFMWCSVLP